MDEILKILDFTLLKFGDFKLVVGNMVAAAFILFVAKIIMMLIRKSLNRRVRSNAMDEGTSFAISQIMKYLVWTFAIVVSLQALGINISLILAGSAALLVGIGLGLQQTFKDFFSGILLLVEGSIKVGDVIEVDKIISTVTGIGIRTATVLTNDDVVIIIPNSILTSEQIINWTHADKLARFQVEIGVAYESDTQLVTKCLLECVAEKERKAGEPTVKLKSFADSAMMFELNFWCDDIRHAGTIKSEIRYRIIEKFKENNIVIPYPQMNVHLLNANK